MSAPTELCENVSAPLTNVADEPPLDPSVSTNGVALQTSSVVPSTGADTSNLSHPTAADINKTQSAAPMSNYNYGAGMGYNGLGGMYGGLGSMYGGMGMGMGGMGMGMGGMGMYGMPGMYGMSGMPMTEDFQRSQMTFMLVGRLLEMCGMFANVIQMTFGSALQFMGNYIGMSEKYNQLNSGMYLDENGNWVRAPKRRHKRPALSSKFVSSRHKKEQGSIWTAILRRIIFLLIAIFLVRKIAGWSEARKLVKLQNQAVSYY